MQVHAEDQLRASVDEIKEWIKKAGKEGDLSKQVVGGLQKTVTADGKTMWLCPEARAAVTRSMEPEPWPEPTP